jgi:hypothetical protein
MKVCVHVYKYMYTILTILWTKLTRLLSWQVCQTHIIMHQLLVLLCIMYTPCICHACCDSSQVHIHTWFSVLSRQYWQNCTREPVCGVRSLLKLPLVCDAPSHKLGSSCTPRAWLSTGHYIQDTRNNVRSHIYNIVNTSSVELFFLQV